eukprot:2737284-Amphidinium_carterae.1
MQGLCRSTTLVSFKPATFQALRYIGNSRSCKVTLVPCTSCTVFPHRTVNAGSVTLCHAFVDHVLPQASYGTEGSIDGGEVAVAANRVSIVHVVPGTAMYNNVWHIHERTTDENTELKCQTVS